MRKRGGVAYLGGFHCTSSTVTHTSASANLRPTFTTPYSTIWNLPSCTSVCMKETPLYQEAPLNLSPSFPSPRPSRSSTGGAYEQDEWADDVVLSSQHGTLCSPLRLVRRKGERAPSRERGPGHRFFHLPALSKKYAPPGSCRSCVCRSLQIPSYLTCSNRQS